MQTLEAAKWQRGGRLAAAAKEGGEQTRKPTTRHNTNTTNAKLRTGGARRAGAPKKPDEGERAERGERKEGGAEEGEGGRQGEAIGKEKQEETTPHDPDDKNPPHRQRGQHSSGMSRGTEGG